MPAFLAAIPAFIAALPALIQLGVQVMTLAVKFIDWAQKNELHKWLKDVENSMDDLKDAKTPEQKISAARSITDLISKLG